MKSWTFKTLMIALPLIAVPVSLPSRLIIPQPQNRDCPPPSQSHRSEGFDAQDWVEFSSYASNEQGGTYCVDRSVWPGQNLQQQLTIHWFVDSPSVDILHGLIGPRLQPLYNFHPHVEEFHPKQSRIFYGRSPKDSLPAKAFVAPVELEQETIAPFVRLISGGFVNYIDEKGELRSARLIVTSSVERAGDQFQYVYQIENRTSSSSKIIWEAANTDAFRAQLAKQIEASGWSPSPDNPVPINEGTIKVSFVSKGVPVISRGSVLFYGKALENVAGFSAPAYRPVQ